MTTPKQYFEIDPWKIKTHTLDRETLRIQESLTSIGNGYMGGRGNFEETYSGDSLNGTYLAGVWYPDKTRVGWWKNGYPDYFGKVINAINFIAMDLYIDDKVVDLAKTEPTDYYQELDFRNGVLTRSFTIETKACTVRFTFERFLSLVTKELSYQHLKIEMLTGFGTVKVVSKLDGNVHNEDSNYDEMFWTERSLGTHENFGYVTAKTIPNQFEIEQFTVTAASQHIVNDALAIPDYKLNPLSVATTFVFDLAPGETTALEKQTAVVTSRDVTERKQVTACAQLFTQQAQSYEDAKKQQTTAWEKRWQLADVEITGDDSAQQGIRFNLFQLFSTYYGEDERLNIGPKGFTGEKYGGATYWDTEAYAVPLYLALADPKVTKNLLKYRHKQLPQAKVNAGKQGLSGALYPMVTFTGIECHNEWEITFEEIHRNGAVAYAIYNYTNYTGDTDYLAHEGLEVLTEIARFWADRVHFSDRVGKYMIHGVTGPNEYENNVNNNWYTNTLAAWVLTYTRESYLKHQKSATVQLSEDELDSWQTIAANMYYPIDEERGIFVQHDTFLDKELRPTTTLDPAERPLNQHWSWDKILRSCFIKQADVLQGIYFFNDRYSLDEKRRNFNFYEPLTVHESSLSASVHAILACELGLTEKAVEMYARTARLDLDNYNNDTDDGLHITSMTGSWLAIVEGFAQMKTSGGALAFAPFLPDNWTSYTFHVNYRERLIKVAVTEKEMSLTLLTGTTLPLSLYGQPYELTESLTVPLPVSEVPYV